MALTIYKSSAGSGKTFTLVKEYLRLVLLNPQDFSRILAITFTNKATEEMKHRILEALLQLGQGEKSDYLALLATDLPQFNEQKIRAQAEKAYDLIIHNYSRFEVVTIDSFFSKVLKSFARELNLPLTYEVEMNTKMALKASIEELYRDIESHPEIKQWLTKFSFHQLEEDKSWNVDKNIQQLGENLFKELFEKGLEGDSLAMNDLYELLNQLKKQKANYENTFIRLGRKALSLIDQHEVALADFSGGAMRSVANTFQKWTQKNFELTNTFVSTTRGEKSWYAQKSPKKDAIQGVLDAGLLDTAQEALAFYESNEPEYLDAKALLKNMYGYGLLEHLHGELKKYRDKHNVMLISDTNSILRKVLNQADAPIIFEKIGSHYKHLMIDEFQDTSDFQWQNLLPLVENSLAEGNEVLIVGDVKQSIYRFRGGNLNLLLRQIQEDLAVYYTPETERILADNYRSLQQIVDFNNKLFEKLPSAMAQHESVMDATFFEQAYKGHTQTIKKGEGGYVSVGFYENEEYQENIVRDLVVAMKTNKDLDYVYSDMLILVNQKKHVLPITQGLLEADIPFVSDESLKLKSNLPVQFVLLLLRYLDRNADEVLVLELIVQFQRLQANNLLQAAYTDKNSRMTLKDAGFPAAFIDKQHELKQQALFDLVCELLLIFQLEEEADLYLQQFLDIVLEQSQKGKNSIASFLEWWESEGSDKNVSIASNDGAVQILTIHKSKGLEAPLVFIPFADWSIQPSGNSEFWTTQLPERFKKLRFYPLTFSKNVLINSSFEDAFYQESAENAMDTLNKTYVAFTRPKHKLFVFSKAFDQNTSKSIQHLLRPIVEQMGGKEVAHSDHVSFTFGEDHPKPTETDVEDKEMEVKDKEMEKNSVLKVYPKVSFLNQLHIRNDSNRFFMLQETSQAKAIILGNQIHDVLSGVVIQEDVPMVLQQRIQSGEMSKLTAQKVQERIHRLFEQPEMLQWFSGGYEVFNERILWHEGSKHKPDRLMFKDKEAVVIDYKKDKEDEAHKRQVQRYMRALKALGYTNIRGYLIYVEHAMLKEVNYA